MVILSLLITGILAGGLGALLGLGGGVVVIPILTILFHFPIHTAIGISLVGVIATSTGAAIFYVREGKADIRLGMILELGTTLGAILGAVLAGYLEEKVLYLLFAAMLGYNAYSMYRKTNKGELAASVENQCAVIGIPGYTVRNIPLGLSLSGLAGIMSGLLGVGGGLIKIPVMYLLMGIPLKVACATSNFMIGVTAAASAFIYFFNGSIKTVETVPIALGVFLGTMIGTRINNRISTTALQKVFVVVFIYIAVQMLLKGLGR